VWICRGEVYGKRDLSPNVGVSTQSNNPVPNNRPMAPKRKKK
jgi:hypothetical protein